MENVKSELDVYLDEDVVIFKETTFDALGWWEANNLKYQILSKMAGDILSIPVTTVASEATFSAGGRVIDTYRAFFGTKTDEVLMCGEDWFRSLHGIRRKIKVSLI